MQANVSEHDLLHVIENILIPHTAFETAMARLEQCFQYAKGATDPMCVAVLGESRTGKSRVIEEFCNRHTAQRTKEGLVIPIVRIRTPSKPTMKGLAELILTAMGEKYNTSGTEITMTKRIKHLFRDCETHVVIVEEFNHFVDTASGKVAFYVTDWLKDIADARNIMLCVSGLPSCQKAISQNEQLAGRFSKPITMPRFDWRKDSDRVEFTKIISSFDAALRTHFDLPALGSSEMAFRFYCATGGIIGYVTKLLREAILLVINQNRVAISLDDLATANELASWCTADTIQPFSKSFTTTIERQHHDALLNQVQLIGTRAAIDDPIPEIDMPIGKRKPNIRQILSATGI